MEKNIQLKKIQNIIVGCMLFLAVVLVVSVFSFISLGKARRANAKYDDFIESLEKQESELKSTINYVTNPEYQKEYARNQLGMIGDGETLYIFK